jgi:DNA invertase Pin-like site-specific DNA recombinase
MNMKAITRPKPKPNGELYEVHRFKTGHSQILGYARVSTRDQSLASQLAQLRDAGACRVIAEKCSSVGARPGWTALFHELRKGDTIAVVRLDRMGRNLGEVVTCCRDITEHGAYVRSIMQGIDTRSPQGRIMLPLWAALAETELAILKERTRAGLEAAREAGRRGGRPPKRSPEKDNLCRHLRAQGFSHGQIAKQLNLGATTVRRALSELVETDPRQLRLDVDAAAATALALASTAAAP